jgi:flavodoxin
LTAAQAQELFSDHTLTKKYITAGFTPSSMKSLVLYYSRTGTTKMVAGMFAEEAKADIEEIIDKKDRSGPVGWIAAGRDAMRKKTTEIGPLKKKMDDYDTIFIGQPVWGWTMVPAIRALADKYDFKGKKIALFCTMDGSGDKGCFEETRKCLPEAEFLGEMSFIKLRKDPNGARKKVRDFVYGLGRTS